MANSNVQNRLDKIEKLQNYLAEVDNRVELIVKELGWSHDSLHESHVSTFWTIIKPASNLSSF